MRDSYINLGLVGSLLGILTNLFLLSVVLRTISNQKLRHYNYLVLVSTLADLNLAIEMSFTQHSILIKNGVSFLITNGPERWLLQTNWITLTFFWHLFSPTLTIMLLAALFHYRYLILLGTQNGRILVRNLICAIIGSLIIATSAAVGIYQAKQRGIEYYMSIAADTRIANQMDEMFVLDSQDLGTKVFLVVSAIGPSMCLILVLVYVVMSWRYLSQVSKASPQRQRLQKEFNRILLVETICGILFTVSPVVFISLNLSLGLRMESHGVLLPSCFLSLLNSVLTLSLVTLYRKECKNMFSKLFARNVNIIYIKTITSSGLQNV